jgi:hypothetical protein
VIPREMCIGVAGSLGMGREQGIKEHYIMEFTSGDPWWLCRKNTWEIISRVESGYSCGARIIAVGCGARRECRLFREFSFILFLKVLLACR